MIIALLVVAVVALAVFVATQARDGATMIDLALFRRPAFVGAQTTAFAISSSMFAMFLYLTLYLQNILGLSPLQTGVRFLPLSVVSFFAAPLAGRLTGRVPMRALLAFGLALNAIAMWSMSRVERELALDRAAARLHPRRHRDRLRERAARDDRGLDRRRAARRDGVGHQQHVPPDRDRHGIAALGAIFASKVGDQHSRAAFVHGLHDILLVGAGVAAIGAVLAGLLVRRQDFVASGPPQASRS